MQKKVSNSLKKGGRFYHGVRHMLWNKKKSQEAKTDKLYHPPISYGAENWTLNGIEWSRVQSGGMKYLWLSVRKSRRDNVRNEDIRILAEKESE